MKTAGFDPLRAAQAALAGVEPAPKRAPKPVALEPVATPRAKADPAPRPLDTQSMTVGRREAPMASQTPPPPGAYLDIRV